MDTKKPLDEATRAGTEQSIAIKTSQPPLSQPQAVGMKKPESPTTKEETRPERSEGEVSRVFKSDETIPLPGVGRKPVVTLDLTKPLDDTLDIDKDTVIYLVYLLFKTNMIARNNLRNMIDEISKPLPDNVLKWLVNEAAKVGR